MRRALVSRLLLLALRIDRVLLADVEGPGQVLIPVVGELIGHAVVLHSHEVVEILGGRRQDARQYFTSGVLLTVQVAYIVAVESVGV